MRANILLLNEEFRHFIAIITVTIVIVAIVIVVTDTTVFKVLIFVIH